VGRLSADKTAFAVAARGVASADGAAVSKTGGWGAAMPAAVTRAEAGGASREWMNKALPPPKASSSAVPIAAIQ
jgi:hypothetical protein